MKGFDVFLLPSIKEGIPYVLLEAGAAKVPIIATNVGGIPDIIKDQETGILIPPRSTYALAKSLEDVFLNYNQAQIRSEQFFDQIQNNFTLQNSVDNTVAIYLSNTI